MPIELKDLEQVVFRQDWEELIMVWIEQRMQEISYSSVTTMDHDEHLKLVGKFSAFSEIYTLKKNLEDSKHSDSSPS